MCASNHPLATTTQFSFRRTRLQVEVLTLLLHLAPPYSSSSSSSSSSSIPRFYIRVSIKSFQSKHRRVSLSLSLSSQLATHPLQRLPLLKANQRLLPFLRMDIVLNTYVRHLVVFRQTAQSSRFAGRASLRAAGAQVGAQPSCELVVKRICTRCALVLAELDTEDFDMSIYTVRAKSSFR